MASLNPLKLKPGQARALVNAPHVRTDLKLLEVDAALLDEILAGGVVIKGPAEGDAVMCTSSKTYALKYVETTNSQLLVQPVEDLPDSAQGTQGAAASPGPACSPAHPSPAGLHTQLFQLRRSMANAPVVVTATTSGHIEVNQCAPRLEVLHHMLAQRPYGLSDEEAEEEGADGAGGAQESGGSGRASAEEAAAGRAGCQAGASSSSRGGKGLYTWEELLHAVQASPAELRAELKSMGALELEGAWRCVDPGYLGELLELIIASAQQEGHPLTAIPASAMAAALVPHGYTPALVTHCLSVFGAPSGSGEAAAEGVWRLDEAKVCVHYLHKVLSAGQGSEQQEQPQHQGGAAKRRRVHKTVVGPPSAAWPLAELMQQWRQAVPSGLQPELEMLRGEVVVEGKGPSALARPLSVRHLPLNSKQRFDALFAFKAQWESSELEPYLQGVQVPAGQTPASLLLLHARASQAKADAPTFYSAR